MLYLNHVSSSEGLPEFQYEGNQFFTRIKFHKICKFWLIWEKLVPAKIITKLSIRKIREI